MEINKIYYDNKKECYFLILSCDFERFYGRTSSVNKPSYMDCLMGLNEHSGEGFAFTDEIVIRFNNIYNPRMDEDFTNYELAYTPSLSQIEEFKYRNSYYYLNKPSEGQ